MNSLQVSFALLALVLVLGAQTGSALKCHICNSASNYEGKECEDPIDEDAHLYDCDEYGRENNWPQYINATLCRKLLQNVQGDNRVVRSCAQEGRTDRCVERTGTKLVKVTYCECEGDGCNGSSTLAIPVITLLVAACSALFMPRS